MTDFTQEGERAIHIGYDFSWPGGGKLGWAFPRFFVHYCAVAMITWGTAARVAEKFTDQHANSTDCTPALGDACVNAILASSVKRNESMGCFDGLWSQLPGCADAFGLDDYGPYGSHRLLLQKYELTDLTQSGRPFHVIPAEGANAELPGLYENAVNMLQVVLLRPPARVTNDTFHPTLHCMRVQTKKEESSAGSGGGEADKGQGVETANQMADDGGEGGNSPAANAGGRIVAAALWTLLMGSMAVALL